MVSPVGPRDYSVFLHIVQSERAGSDKVRHDPLGAAAEESQQVPVVRGVAGDHRFENMSVADLLDAAERLFTFQPVDGGLNRRIRGSVRFGKRLLDLSNGRRASGPERLHDLKFQLR